MNLKALITTVVLGTSSIAAASPEVRDHRTHKPVPVQSAPAPVAPVAPILQADFHMGFNGGFVRPVRPRPLPMPQPPMLTWVTLANDLDVNGREIIRVSPSQRAFTKLELRTQGQGRTKIDRIVIMFANGRSQVIEQNKVLNNGNRSLSIDLTGNTRNIRNIVLVGKSNRRASLDILAL